MKKIANKNVVENLTNRIAVVTWSLTQDFKAAASSEYAEEIFEEDGKNENTINDAWTEYLDEYVTERDDQILDILLRAFGLNSKEVDRVIKYIKNTAFGLEVSDKELRFIERASNITNVNFPFVVKAKADEIYNVKK